ncbi:MAG: serine/threonine-protein kinase [Pyrinomonadaceae bacterium]
MFIADQQIGPYTLIRRIGRGGFGEVWLAERRSQFFSKKLAIKLPLDEQVDLKTISQEAVLWEQASGHPNVLPIIDADVYDGQIVIASEYAEGGSLADKLKLEGALPPVEAVQLTIGILKGLEFLHGRKIIHRDVKPENVLLQGETPRLADFGISRAMQSSSNSALVAGTDAYMSPESFKGERSAQTDIWSVGVVLFELLNGGLPFPQEHPSERMYAILSDEPRPLTVEAPRRLKAILERSLAKSPDVRYRSAREMRDDLRWALGEFSQASTVIGPSVVDLSPDQPSPAPSPSGKQIEPPRPTALVMPPASGPSDGPGLFGQYADQSIDQKPNWPSFVTVAGVMVAVLALSVLGAMALVSLRIIRFSDPPSDLTENYMPSPTPIPSSTPTPTPTPTPTASVTPIPPADREGRYTGSYGSAEISAADEKGFTFRLNTGNGAGGIGELDGKAFWIEPTTAVHTNIPDQEHYDDPESIWYKKKCKVTFKFSGTQLKTIDGGGPCLYYHGAGSTLNGTFVLNRSKANSAH